MPQLEYRKTVQPDRPFERRQFSSGIIALLIIAVAATGPRASDDLLDPAEQLIRQGRYVEARTELGRIAEEHQGGEVALIALLRQIDLERDGTIYLARLEELYSSIKDARVLFAIGRYRYAVGAYSAAAADFRAARRGLDDNTGLEAKVWEGAALLGAGDRKKGIAILSDAAGSSSGEEPVRHRARFLAAQSLSVLGDHRGSVAMAAELMESENDYSAPAGLLAAQGLLDSGDRKGAHALFEQLIGRYPESGEGSAARDALLTMGAEEASPRQATEGGWFVQIASFLNELNARRFVAAKRAEGIGAVEMYHEVRNGESVFPIRIGPFDGEKEARTAASNLAAQNLEGNVIHVAVPDGAATAQSKPDSTLKSESTPE